MCVRVNGVLWTSEKLTHWGYTSPVHPTTGNKAHANLTDFHWHPVELAKHSQHISLLFTSKGNKLTMTSIRGSTLSCHTVKCLLFGASLECHVVLCSPEVPMVLYLFALVSLVCLWAGLHMAYRYLWMLILLVIFNVFLVSMSIFIITHITSLSVCKIICRNCHIYCQLCILSTWCNKEAFQGIVTDTDNQ